ncbi:DUF2933 domain-containing protein [Kamptonema cortianum]|jgi:hypothetical protein|nr:DUF2933 domain-containing protein [Kamptonema cortianum]
METLKNTTMGQWVLSHVGLTIFGLIAATLFVMIIAALASLSAVLPYFLLLLCPLAHLFLHSGHGAKQGQDNSRAMQHHAPFDTSVKKQDEA